MIINSNLTAETASQSKLLRFQVKTLKFIKTSAFVGFLVKFCIENFKKVTRIIPVGCESPACQPYKGTGIDGGVSVQWRTCLEGPVH